MIKRLILAATMLLTAFSALATPPCPPPPCAPVNGRFDAKLCDGHADWVAVGHVVNVRHHFQGYPFNHDFAKFTFAVDRWVKGGDGLPKQILFNVGWCSNSEEMRGDGGLFMFWGKNKPAALNAEWEYLWFQPLEERR